MEYITLEEFARHYNLKPATIKKNIERIPGVEYVDRKYRVLEGTRYFYVSRSEIKTQSDQIFVILKALDNRRFVDEEILNCTKNEFNNLLNQLQKEGLIEENSSQNQYGANGYSLTLKGIEYSKMEKRQFMKYITEIAGTFLGAVINQNIPK